MNEKATLSLSRLREIAWSAWDPIGLGGAPVDEYDRYLLRLVGLVRNGAADAECIDYLVKAEFDQMGLRDNPDAQDRAIKTVILVREYLATLPSGSFTIRE